MATFKYIKCQIVIMDKIKLDLKDRRLLDVLDKEPNILVSRLAKRIAVSRQVTEYRINRLLSQGTIYNFFTLIDPARMGYTLFRVHIKLKNVPEREYEKFAKDLFVSYPTFWVAFVSGAFDIMTDIWARNSNEFELLFSKLLAKNKDIINSYEINPILEISLYNYGFFLENKSQRKRTVLFRNTGNLTLNETDRKILQNIKNNSRMSYEDIGKRVGLTRNTIKNRIISLEKKKIIGGYKMMINFKHFNRLTYKIFIKYDNSKISQEKELLDYIQSKQAILSLTKHLGRWNLDVEIEPEDAKDLQKFIIELRSRFGIVENYEFVQILDDYGLDFYPDGFY